MAAVHHITAFVDWDTARRLASTLPSVGQRYFDSLFDQLQRIVAKCVTDLDSRNLYRVRWRLYHGWYRGKTKTADRIAVEKYLFALRSRTIKRVSFGNDFAFSDFPCCRSRRSPIVDTLRLDPETGRLRQKMVDASLICDLLYLVRSRDSDLYIVMANDDDFIPALFTAEMWRGKAILLHNRSNINPHLQLEGIAVKMDIE
jgi:hypothetical protein